MCHIKCEQQEKYFDQNKKIKITEWKINGMKL